MNEEKKQVVINDLRKRIQQAKAKGIGGKRISDTTYSFFRGELLILLDLELITFDEWKSLTDDIGIASIGQMGVA